jgi:predicted TIM-barrel fold metal-dependent hydrolase
LHLKRVVPVQPSPNGTDNACLLDALHTLGIQARAVAVVDDATGDADLHQLYAAGVQGVRLNLETAGAPTGPTRAQATGCALRP